MDHPIIFYDGVCGMCNAFVDLVLKVDKHGVFRFAALQGETARKKLPPATGATIRAGIKALRRAAPARIVLAVPVGPPESVRSLSGDVDELICLETPAEFTAVGEFYGDFRQTTDAEVIAALEKQRVAGMHAK